MENKNHSSADCEKTGVQGSESRANRILIVDDNLAIHDDFRKILVPKEVNQELQELDSLLFGESAPQQRRTDCELLFASQGEKARDLVESEKMAGREIQMAFVDMRMPPGWDGSRTIQEIWEIDPRIKVVICTAYSDKKWSEIAEELNTPEQLLILKKPFDEVEVIQLAESLCERWHLEEADATSRRRMENEIAIHKSELKDAHFDAEQLVNSTVNLVVAVDNQLVVRRWNPAAEKCFGIDAAHAIGRPISDLDINWKDPVDWKQLCHSSISEDAV